MWVRNGGKLVWRPNSAFRPDVTSFVRGFGRCEGIGILKRRFGKGSAPRHTGAPLRRAVVSVERLIKDLHDPFHHEDAHHRWLLTTCIAGIAGTLIIGSAVLSIFGQNAVPNDAYASIEPSLATASLPADQKAADHKTAAVVPERDLDGDNTYPEITSDALPYGDGKTVVLDAEIQAVDTEPTNITTIAKTPPPEPVDENFKLAKGNTLVDELVNRGVTIEAAKSLAAAIEPIFPARMMKPGTLFELTSTAAT
jgi:hypothetical protein